MPSQSREHHLALREAQIATVLSLCEVIGSPRSLAVYLLLKYQEFDQYLELKCDPSNYDTSSNFAEDYLVTEILRKSPYLPIDVDKREAALESFWVSELQCFQSNVRLRSTTSKWDNQLRRGIAELCGPLTLEALIAIENDFSHGPGSNVGFVASGRAKSDKFDEIITSTIELMPFYKSIVGPMWHQCYKKPIEIVGGSKFTSVPKTAKTDRGIATEPLLNMFVQKGIGSYLRRQLRKHGLDLNTGSDTNRDLARCAHLGLATIDLSSASDSICTELVLQFFPHCWVELLSLARSHRILVDNEYHELEKFSSMGNGFTFELESLIFLAVCRAIVPRSSWAFVSVFGDDIILPRQYASEVIECLSFLGFRTNAKKTYLAGRFFESCGTDWFDGRNVRPFYLKEVGNRIPVYLQIANKLRLWLQRVGTISSDSRFKSIWVNLKDSTPLPWRQCLVPPSLGDTGFIASFEEAMPGVARDEWDGWFVRHVLLTPVYRKKKNMSPYLLYLMHGGYEDSLFTRGREPLRGLYGRIRSKHTHVPNGSWDRGLAWD